MIASQGHNFWRVRLQIVKVLDLRRISQEIMD